MLSMMRTSHGTDSNGSVVGSSSSLQSPVTTQTGPPSSASMRICGAHDVSGGMQADHHLAELMRCAPLEREAVLVWSVSGSNQIGGPLRAHVLIASGWGMVGVGVGGDRSLDRTAGIDEKPPRSQ